MHSKIYKLGRTEPEKDDDWATKRLIAAWEHLKKNDPEMDRMNVLGINSYRNRASHIADRVRELTELPVFGYSEDGDHVVPVHPRSDICRCSTCLSVFEQSELTNVTAFDPLNGFHIYGHSPYTGILSIECRKCWDSKLRDCSW